jgi:predicted MFS family arabinose efflux permease
MTQSANSPGSDGGAGIGGGLLAIMAIGSGIAVANLYYIQPLLADIGRTFAVSASAMGVVVMLAQLGFATGMLFFVPLGDISERRRLILVMLVGAAASLALVAFARSYAWVAGAMFLVGAFSVTPQMFVPFAAHLATPERRGRAVGIVMSGLLMGILLSRTASGYIGAAAGWRGMCRLASGVTLVLAALMAVALPRSTGVSRLSYWQLIRSLWQLIRTEAVLRESSFAGAMLFASFSAFWSMLTFRLETPPLHYGSQVAGLFGLVGVAGAGAAPIAGRLADRLNPRTNVQISMLATALSYGLFVLFGHTIAGLVAGVVLLDASVQAGHVTNLFRVHGLAPAARNRVTTIYMVAFFLGGAAGSALSAFAWQHWRWAGVCAVGSAMPLLALAESSKVKVQSEKLEGRRWKVEGRAGSEVPDFAFVFCLLPFAFCQYVVRQQQCAARRPSCHHPSASPGCGSSVGRGDGSVRRRAREPARCPPRAGRLDVAAQGHRRKGGRRRSASGARQLRGDRPRARVHAAVSVRSGPRLSGRLRPGAPATAKSRRCARDDARADRRAAEPSDNRGHRAVSVSRRAAGKHAAAVHRVFGADGQPRRGGLCSSHRRARPRRADSVSPRASRFLERRPYPLHAVFRSGPREAGNSAESAAGAAAARRPRVHD